MASTTILYARVSDDSDGTSESPDSQLAACRREAERLGLTITTELADRNISGFTGATRPAFEELLGLVANGDADEVMAFEWSRFSRNEKDALRLRLAAIDGGVRLRTVVDDVDSDDEMGAILRALQQVKAAGESRAISKRVKRFNEDRAKAGLPHPSGARAYGYTRAFDIVAEEAANIREAKDRVLAGESLSAICNDFNERGTTTTRGKQWRATTLKRMLLGVHLVGQRKHKDEIYDGTWQPILTKQDRRRLLARLDDPSRVTRGSAGTPYLLTGGLVRCAKCDQPMLSRQRTSGKRAYGCRRDSGARDVSCGSVTVVAGPLDKWVTTAVVEAVREGALDDVMATEAQDDDRLQAITEGLASDRTRLDELTKARYVDGLLGQKEFEAAHKALTAKIEGAEAELHRRSRAASVLAVGGSDELVTKLEDSTTPVAWRREAIAMFLDHVAIGPVVVPGRKTFDPDRITRAVWRV